MELVLTCKYRFILITSLIAFLIGFGIGSISLYFAGMKNGITKTLAAIQDAPMGNAEVEAMYEITEFVTEIFTQEKINYWLWRGSLIGALRNQPPGPLLWDNSVDLAILQEEQKKLSRLIKKEKFSSTVEAISTEFGYQMRLQRYKANTAIRKSFYLNIFVLTKRNGKHGKKWYCKSPKYEAFFYKNLQEIFPLQKCQFWDLMLNCPNDPETVNRGYKGGIMKWATIYNHNIKRSCKFSLWNKLALNLLIPAMPQHLLLRLNFIQQTRSKPHLDG